MMTLFRSLFAPPRDLVLVLVALWLGMVLTERRAARHAIAKDALNNIIFYSMLGYVLGGRLLFVLENLSAFRGSPRDFFSINVELFDPLGALVAAVLIGLIYGQRLKLSLRATMDALTPFLAMVAVGLSLSHLAAGTAFGKPTNLAWAIDLWNAKRHPTQIYELLASLVVFGIIWFRKIDSPSGTTFVLFVSWTAGARLFLEAFRGDSTLVFGGIRLAQVIAWLVLAAALSAGEAFRREAKAP